MQEAHLGFVLPAACGCPLMLVVLHSECPPCLLAPVHLGRARGCWVGLVAEAPDLLVAAKGIAGTGVEAEVETQASGIGEPGEVEPGESESVEVEPGEAGPGIVEEEKVLLAPGRVV